MLRKHQVNWAAWRPTLVLTQQTNYIIAVHIGNHTPQASSLLLFFSRERKTSNHGPKPWTNLLETFCTGHSLHSPLHQLSCKLLSQEQGVSHGWWLITCLLLPSFCRSPTVPPSSSTQTTSASITFRQTCTEHKPHSSQLLLRKTKWTAPAQSLKKTTIFQEVLMNCMLQLQIKTAPCCSPSSK